MSRVINYGIVCLLLALPLAAATPDQGFYQRGTIYLDWYGTRAPDGTMFNQISARFRFDLISRPGSGWTLAFDARDRIGLIETTTTPNQVILYNARLTYDRAGSPFYLSVGQMNMYDSAGIGELLGGIAGFKIRPSLLVGGYGGFESSPYVKRLEKDYLKFGAFVRWLGSQGKSVTLSYNQLRYLGQTERSFGYANVFLPIERVFTLYGDMEYELGAHTASQNRLSRLFLNGRLDLGRWADLTGFYSSGKGLDYHQYLIEASQNPALNDQNVERFFYSDYYGARLSVKPTPNVRLSASRQESRQRDLGIVNHTWRVSASAWNLLGRGLSVTGDYAMNNGDSAESNSYYVSVTKEFGRFSVSGSVSNTYNGIRFDTSGGTPQPIHLTNYQNYGLSTFIHLSRRLMLSVEYIYYAQPSANQHSGFVRLIYKTY